MAKKAVTAEKGKKRTGAGRNPAGGKDNKMGSLAQELMELIPQLDQEGLAFLLEQAKVHLYNMRVDELNKAALEADREASRKGAAVKAGGGRGAPKEPNGGLSIRGTESGSSYYLHYRNDDIMFSRSEMAHLVKIANGEGTNLEIRERLYNWFERERRDIFSVVPIADKYDERLKALSALIKKSFSIRGN